MTTEQFDATKAWGEVDLEENPAKVKADAEQEPNIPLSEEEQALAAARQAAEEDLGIKAKEPDATDQFARLQEEMKEQREAHTKQLRDLNGRYGGLQRELEQVRQEATVARATAATPAVQEAIAQAAKSPEKWDAFKEEWKGSGMTEAIESFVESQTSFDPKILDQQLAAQKKELQELYDARIAKAEAEVVNLKMTIARSDWREVVRSDAFQEWRAAQPPAIQNMAFSPNTEDALEMLRLFDKSTAPAADTNKQNRERLEQAVNPSRAEVTPRKTLSLQDMTPKQMWAYEARMEQAKAGSH